MKKTINLAVSALLALMLALGVLSLSSCGAPKLEEVKDEFTRLIKESFAVNEILFGDGLSGYGSLDYDEASKTYYIHYYTRTDGQLCAYRDQKLGKYVVLCVSDTDGEGCVYKNEEKGRYYFPTELEYTEANSSLPDTPMGYRHVRTDERCTSINEISAMAAKVYSEDYLADMFTMIFSDGAPSDIDIGFTPKYIEFTDEHTNKKYLLCADATTCPPLIDEERVYDYDTMRIGKNSRSSHVNIEIRAYGKYADIEKGAVAVGWHDVTLSFVRQGNEWRLDSPTY